jgi:hypothetical protein
MFTNQFLCVLDHLQNGWAKVLIHGENSEIQTFFYGFNEMFIIEGTHNLLTTIHEPMAHYIK